MLGPLRPPLSLLMLSRLLLGALVLAVIALVLSRVSGPSDIDCGPVVGTVAVADGRASADLARVSVGDARAAALVAVPGAVVTDVDLDEEDGFLVYEIELAHNRQERSVIVDAGTGTVLCTERD